MLGEVLMGIVVMLLCLFLQSLLLAVTILYYRRRESVLDTPSFLSTLLVLKSVMLILVVGNLAQIAIWGGLFMLVGEFRHFEPAFYFSAVNFSTLGYGDIVMSAQYRVLGPLEALNGVIMIGVSTAALMAAFQDSMRRTLRAREVRAASD